MSKYDDEVDKLLSNQLYAHIKMSIDKKAGSHALHQQSGNGP
jgi:hypothetical protein